LRCSARGSAALVVGVAAPDGGDLLLGAPVEPDNLAASALRRAEKVNAEDV